MPALNLQDIPFSVTQDSLQQLETEVYLALDNSASPLEVHEKILVPLMGWVESSFSSADYSAIRKEAEHEISQISRNSTSLDYEIEVVRAWLNAARLQEILLNKEETKTPKQIAEEAELLAQQYKDKHAQAETPAERFARLTKKSPLSRPIAPIPVAEKTESPIPAVTAAPAAAPEIIDVKGSLAALSQILVNQTNLTPAERAEVLGKAEKSFVEVHDPLGAQALFNQIERDVSNRRYRSEPLDLPRRAFIRTEPISQTTSQPRPQASLSDLPLAVAEEIIDASSKSRVHPVDSATRILGHDLPPEAAAEVAKELFASVSLSPQQATSIASIVIKSPDRAAAVASVSEELTRSISIPEASSYQAAEAIVNKVQEVVSAPETRRPRNLTQSLVGISIPIVAGAGIAAVPTPSPAPIMSSEAALSIASIIGSSPDKSSAVSQVAAKLEDTYSLSPAASVQAANSLISQVQQNSPPSSVDSLAKSLTGVAIPMAAVVVSAPVLSSETAQHIASIIGKSSTKEAAVSQVAVELEKSFSLSPSVSTQAAASLIGQAQQNPSNTSVSNLAQSLAGVALPISLVSPVLTPESASSIVSIISSSQNRTEAVSQIAKEFQKTYSLSQVASTQAAETVVSKVQEISSSSKGHPQALAQSLTGFAIPTLIPENLPASRLSQQPAPVLSQESANNIASIINSAPNEQAAISKVAIELEKAYSLSPAVSAQAAANIISQAQETPSSVSSGNIARSLTGFAVPVAVGAGIAVAASPTLQEKIQSSAAVSAVSAFLTDAGIDSKTAQPVLDKVSSLPQSQLKNYLSSGIMADLPSNLSPTKIALLSDTSTLVESIPVIQNIAGAAVASGTLPVGQLESFSRAIASRYPLQQISVADVQNIAADYKVSLSDYVISQSFSGSSIPLAPIVAQQVSQANFFQLSQAVQAASSVSGINPDAVQIYSIANRIRSSPQPDVATLANDIFNANPSLTREAAFSTAENIYSLSNVYLQLDKVDPAARLQQSIDIVAANPGLKAYSAPQLYAAVNVPSPQEAVSNLQKLGLSPTQISQVVGAAQISQADTSFTAVASPVIDKNFGFTVTKILSASSIPEAQQANIVSQLSQIGPNLSISEAKLAIGNIVPNASPQLTEALAAYATLSPENRASIDTFYRQVSPLTNMRLSDISTSERSEFAKQIAELQKQFPAGSVDAKKFELVSYYFPLLQNSPPDSVVPAVFKATTGSYYFDPASTNKFHDTAASLSASLIKNNPTLQALYETNVKKISYSTGFDPDVIRPYAQRIALLQMQHPDIHQEEIEKLLKYYLPHMEASSGRAAITTYDHRLLAVELKQYTYFKPISSKELAFRNDIGSFLKNAGVSLEKSQIITDNIKIPYYFSSFAATDFKNLALAREQQAALFQQLLPKYLDQLNIDPRTQKTILANARGLFDSLQKYAPPTAINPSLENRIVLSDFARQLSLDHKFDSVMSRFQQTPFSRKFLPFLSKDGSYSAVLPWSQRLAIDHRTVLGNKILNFVPQPVRAKINTAVAQAFTKAGSKLASSAVGKLAAKAGITAAMQAIGSSVPIVGNIVAFAAGWIVEKVGQALQAIASTISGIIHDNLAPIGYAALNSLAGLGIFAPPAGSGSFAQGIINAARSGLSAASAISSELLIAVLDTTFATFAIIALSVPILLALFIYIITAGAYIVPPLPAGMGQEGCWPVDEGLITTLPPHGANNNLDAFDIAGNNGTTVYASITGTVIYAGLDPQTAAQGSGANGGGYGNYVKIDSGLGYCTIYGHMSEVLVTQGQTVSVGTELGHVDNTGFSTGPHLHYEWQVGCTFQAGATEIINHVPLGDSVKIGTNIQYPGSCFSSQGSTSAAGTTTTSTVP